MALLLLNMQNAVQLGAERLVLDSALSTSKDQIKQAAAVGQQALIDVFLSADRVWYCSH